MNKQKEANYLGIVFIGVIVAELLASTLLGVLTRAGVELPTICHTIIAELAILLPVFIFIKIKKEKFFGSFGFHKIKVSTFFLTILLAIVTAPIGYFANVVSQFFVPNTMVQLADGLAESSVLGTMITTAVVAPLVEEMVLRGFFFKRLNKLTSVVVAAAISGLLFGLVHLNLNQFCYAFALGFIFAIANFASGSLWTSIIMHAWFNFWNISLMLFMNWAYKMNDMNLSDAAENVRANSSQMYITAIVLFFIAIGCAFLVKLILRAIAKRQGNLEAFDRVFNKKKVAAAAVPQEEATEAVSEVAANEEKVRCFFNIPMLIGVIIAVGTIIAFDFLGV